MTDKITTTANPVGKPNREGIYRNGFGLRSTVSGEIASDYHCDIVEFIKSNDYRLDAGPLQVHLAREFGFCYGVEKAVDYAYQTRRMFPGKRVFLTTEIIHNPRVNKRLIEMGVGFLSGQYCDGVGFDDVEPDDVVILPAFGASISEIEQLRAHHCTLVDTTCGSVIHVWKRVEKYARDGFTSIIHGKYAHEETIATSSRVLQFPEGKYLIVRDKEQAQTVCDFIAGKVSAEEIRQEFALSASPGFDPDADLVRVGVANQTTMLSSESLEIAEMVRREMVSRYGEETADEHFRNFDTICSATQERQDAVKAFASMGIDLILVIGGFNSSNTTHLVEIAGHLTRAYHIDDVSQILSAGEIRHKPWDRKEMEIARDWLPPLPFQLGITAGASTPNRAIGEVIERIIGLCGLPQPQLPAATAGPELIPAE